MWMLIAAAALVGGQACSSPEQAPPVAKVTVTLSRHAVALGAPVDLTYRFDVAPDAKIGDDYRVFVHLSRDDGTVIWNDDHDLPQGLETSRWEPGQVVQYTRTRFVPTFSYLGAATLHVGLYREEQRLPLDGPDPADRERPERSYKVATLELLPRSESIQLIRLSGWHPGEYSSDDSSVEWQWTQGVATFSLRNPRRDITFYLEYDGRPDVFADAHQQVTVYAGESVLETFAVDRPGVQLRRVPVTADQLGTGEMAEVRVEVDRTFVPAKLPGGSGDARELGIRVFHAFVEPR